MLGLPRAFVVALPSSLAGNLPKRRGVPGWQASVLQHPSCVAFVQAPDPYLEAYANPGLHPPLCTQATRRGAELALTVTTHSYDQLVRPTCIALPSHFTTHAPSVFPTTTIGRHILHTPCHPAPPTYLPYTTLRPPPHIPPHAHPCLRSDRRRPNHAVLSLLRIPPPHTPHAPLPAPPTTPLHIPLQRSSMASTGARRRNAATPR